MLARTDPCCPHCGRPVSAGSPVAGSKPKVAAIISAVAALCDLTPEQVVSPGKATEPVYARILVSHIACRHFGHTPSVVARVCRRDRSSIVHAIGRASILMIADPTVGADIKAVLKMLGGGR